MFVAELRRWAGTNVNRMRGVLLYSWSFRVDYGDRCAVAQYTTDRPTLAFDVNLSRYP
jgi:hypothetical protein